MDDDGPDTGYQSWNEPTDLVCLDDHGEDTCEGAVEYREPLSSTGKSFPRCEKHWDKRLEVQEDHNRKYPTHQPADFDPLYAGERWYEDE